MRLSHLYAAMVALTLGVSNAWAQSADELPCDATGLEHCFSPQFIMVNHTPDRERVVRTNPTSSGQHVLGELLAGVADPMGEGRRGALFIWLKSDIASQKGWKIPAELMREFRFGSRGTPVVVPASFILDPASFPQLDDPRLPNLSDPHYVLAGTPGKGGIGWSFPKAILKDIAYIVYCPYDDVVSSYPDRRDGKENGIHFTPSDIAMWQAAGWEYTMEPVLVVQ